MRFVLMLMLLLPRIAHAEPTDAFAGKTINIVIGYSAGGGYDLYARLLARHLGGHIPGNPTVVSQNMSGAGSLKAANYIYSLAPKDGTAIAAFARGMAVDPLMVGNGKFDGRKFVWLGSITRDTGLCVVSATSPIKNFADLFTKPSRFGGEGAGSDPDVFATVLRVMFGAKVQLVTGYPGTADMTLAMERGELDGLCGISLSTIVSRHQDWIDNHKITILTQVALKKDPALPDVPMLLDLMNDQHKKDVLKLIIGPQTMARPFTLPPDTPPERVAILRRAFAETMADKAFLDEAGRLGLDVLPVWPDEIDALLADFYAAPKDILKEAAAASGG